MLLRVVLFIGRAALKCMTCTENCTIGHSHGKEKAGPKKPEFDE